MRKVFAFILAAVLVPSGLMVAAAQKKTASTAKKSTATAKKSSTTAKKPATSAKKSSSKKSSSKKKTTARSKQTWRSRQLQPTPERYSEIQRALIDKGYLQGEATGKWDQASIDALRRFQQEQNLDPSGKIDSLSLIALGLGPKYDTAAVAAAPPPVPRAEPRP